MCEIRWMLSYLLMVKICALCLALTIWRCICVYWPDIGLKEMWRKKTCALTIWHTCVCVVLLTFGIVFIFRLVWTSMFSCSCSFATSMCMTPSILEHMLFSLPNSPFKVSWKQHVTLWLYLQQNHLNNNYSYCCVTSTIQNLPYRMHEMVKPLHLLPFFFD